MLRYSIEFKDTVIISQKDIPKFIAKTKKRHPGSEVKFHPAFCIGYMKITSVSKTSKASKQRQAQP